MTGDYVTEGRTELHNGWWPRDRRTNSAPRDCATERRRERLNENSYILYSSLVITWM